MRGRRPGGPGVSINRHPPVSPLDRGGEQPVYRRLDRLASELRNREKVLGTTIDSRRDLRIRYTEPRVVAAGRDHEPRPVPDL